MCKRTAAPCRRTADQALGFSDCVLNEVLYCVSSPSFLLPAVLQGHEQGVRQQEEQEPALWTPSRM